MEIDKPVYAFPLPSEQCVRGYDTTQSAEPGMTLRDYFAARAMQSLFNSNFSSASHYDTAAEASYQMADAMLVARLK